MKNHWILGALAESYAREEREKAMTTEQYDQLLAEIRSARKEAAAYRRIADQWENRVSRLLKELNQEDSRIAHDALTSIHSASRKLVVGE